MQQLLAELEKLCLQPEKDAPTIRQIDLLMSKIERFVLVQREEFELWLITAEKPDELLANLVAILADCFQYTSPSAKISAQLIVQLIPYFSSSDLITLNTFLSSLKKLATKVSKEALIPSTSIEIIFQQITQHATASSLDIINMLETMVSIKDISESNWSNISRYFEWLINQILHISSPEQLNKLFDLLVILCKSKSGLLHTVPTNLLNKILSNIDIRHTQQLIHYIQKINILTHRIPTKLKTSTIESICANILSNNNLESHALIDIWVSLAQLCELNVFTENVQAKYPQEIIKKLLSKQLNQADLLKTLVFLPYFLNHYQQQMEIYSQFLELAHHIISRISENTLANLNPQQKQGIRHKLANHHALLKLIDNKMIQQETPSDIIQVILSGDLSLFKSMLQEMTEEDIISLFYQRQNALKPLLDYPHFLMFLEELLKNCYIDSCIQLILDGNLDYFYLNFSKHSLNSITQVFFDMYLHHDINVINRLLDLLNVRKKSAKNADDANMYHQLQIKILQSALESYQKSNSNLEYHASIKQKIQELHSQQLDNNQDMSLKHMHAYQQAEFAAHHLMNSNGEPNLSAFYVENDVQTLLSTRLTSNPTIHVLAALDPNFLSFKELVELAIKNNMNYETIVIPIHNGHHWVGISIQKTAQAKPLVTFYDSIPDAQRATAYQELLTPIIENTLGKTISWKIKENMLVQEDGTSCGAYLIENLASDFLSEDEPPPANNLAIRQFHLALLLEQHPDVYAEQFELASNDIKIDVPELEYTPSCIEKLLSLMISINNKAHLMPQLDYLDPSLNSTLLTYCSKNTPEKIYILPIHINQQWVFCIIQPGQISIYDTHPKKINEAQLRQKIHADFVINSGTTPFTQTIESDNGPLLIETIRHVLNPEMPVSLPKDIANLRAMHLESLYQYTPEFYKTLHFQKPTEETNTHLLTLKKS